MTLRGKRARWIVVDDPIRNRFIELIKQGHKRVTRKVWNPKAYAEADYYNEETGMFGPWATIYDPAGAYAVAKFDVAREPSAPIEPMPFKVIIFEMDADDWEPYDGPSWDETIADLRKLDKGADESKTDLP